MSVYLELEGNQRKLGTLAWSGRERRAYFEYAAEFLAAPFLISPFHMMASTGLIALSSHHRDNRSNSTVDSSGVSWVCALSGTEFCSTVMRQIRMGCGGPQWGNFGLPLYANSGHSVQARRRPIRAVERTVRS